jgi:hypothetical protein
VLTFGEEVVAVAVMIVILAATAVVLDIVKSTLQSTTETLLYI